MNEAAVPWAHPVSVRQAETRWTNERRLRRLDGGAWRERGPGRRNNRAMLPLTDFSPYGVLFLAWTRPRPTYYVDITIAIAIATGEYGIFFYSRGSHGHETKTGGKAGTPSKQTPKQPEQPKGSQ